MRPRRLPVQESVVLLAHLEERKLQAKLALDLNRQISEDEKATVCTSLIRASRRPSQQELTVVVDVLQPVKGRNQRPRESGRRRHRHRAIL